MARRRIALWIGIYVAVVVLLTIPAVLLLIDRGVPGVIALVLGFMLAQVAIIALAIPLRIFVALRERDRSHRDSN